MLLDHRSRADSPYDDCFISWQSRTGRHRMISPRRWVTATFLGWTAGFVLAILLIIGVESAGLREVQFPLALGMGLGVGFVQARALTAVRQLRRRWVLATAAGLAAPFLVADFARHLELNLPYSLPAFVAIGGFCVSVFQFQLLRNLVRRPVLWLVLTPLGWLLAASTVAFNDRYLPKIPGILGALLFVGIILLGGLLLGITGAGVLARASDTI